MAEKRRRKFSTLFLRWRQQRRPGCLGSTLMVDQKRVPPPFRRQLIAMALVWVALVALVVGVFWAVGTGP